MESICTLSGTPARPIKQVAQSLSRGLAPVEKVHFEAREPQDMGT